MTVNDNDPETPGDAPSSPDAHGRAALLLVESLIHGLCESTALSTSEAVEITERAISVQFDQAQAAADAAEPMWRSHSLLSSIASSLRADDKGDPRSPYAGS